MRVLYSILSVLAFYFFYWLGRSILFSFVDGTWTLENIVKAEWYLAGFIGVIICLFADNSLNESFDEDSLYPYILTVSTVFVTYLPYSIGLAILYNIVVLSCVLHTIWTCDKYRYE